MTDEVLDAKIQKAIGEAERGLANLARELKSVTAKLGTGNVDPKKTKAAYAKVDAYMNKYKAITRIQGSPAYDSLSALSQAQVTWFDGIMGELLILSDKLANAKPLAAKDPKKQWTILIKASRDAVRSGQSQPKGVGTLLKMAEKGFDADSPLAGSIGILPMAILLWMIYDTIVRGFSRKPK